MNENFKNFLEHIKTECNKFGVEIKEYQEKFINLSENIQCSGFFDDSVNSPYVDKPTLAYANSFIDSPEVIIHEYCHMTQWLEGIELWRKANDSMVIVDKWLEGQDFDNIDIHLSNVRDLELDNEKRTVEMIKKWSLPIDIELYTKKANAYVQFYNYLKETRRWSKPGRAPYSVIEILNVMSDKFDMNYLELESNIREIFIKENI